jgi:hypothetical protein
MLHISGKLEKQGVALVCTTTTATDCVFGLFIMERRSAFLLERAEYSISSLFE